MVALDGFMFRQSLLMSRVFFNIAISCYITARSCVGYNKGA